MAAGSLFVGAALLDIELGEELVGAQQMAQRFGCAMGQKFHRLHRDAGQPRHPHPWLRPEDEFCYRRGDVLGLGVLRPFVPPIPEVSSVLVKVGRTAEIATPVPADSSLTASLKPSTPYLVAQ